MTTGKQFITRSTAKSAKTEEIDGVEHYVISMGVTSDSHPFFTGPLIQKDVSTSSRSASVLFAA